MLLFVPLLVWHAAREPRLRLLPFLAALLFLLLLAGWSVEIKVWPDIAIPPGAWTPEVVQALLATAALIAGCFAASGLWFERRAMDPLPWAGLAASVPVLALAICYGRVAEVQPRAGWAAFAVLLAVGLTGAAAVALREGHPASRERAGIHAAGAVAALALGCAMLLRDHWLTLAVSLFLPALAWIAAQVDLPALRRVALAIAALVLVRLLLNWYVLDYGFGRWPVVNGLIVAYALPAVAFALAATMFRRQADDLTVGAYQADPDGNSAAGASYVVFGKDGGTAVNLSAVAAGAGGGFVINGIAERLRPWCCIGDGACRERWRLPAVFCSCSTIRCLPLWRRLT